MLNFYLLMNSLFSQAAGATQGKASIFSAILPFVLIFVIFYFLLIRPQQKQRTKHADFLAKLKDGEEVITNSGIIGTVKSINDQSIYLEISKGVEVKMLKSFINSSAKDAFVVEKTSKK